MINVNINTINQEDWEEVMCGFLSRAASGMEDESEIAEEMLEYVLELARDEFAKGYNSAARKG